MSNGFFTSGMAGTTPNFNPVPSVLTPTLSPAPVDTTFQSQVAAPALIPQQSGGFLSSAFDFLGSDVFNQALRTGGQYYLGQENIKGVPLIPSQFFSPSFFLYLQAMLRRL